MISQETAVGRPMLARRTPYAEHIGRDYGRGPPVPHDARARGRTHDVNKKTVKNMLDTAATRTDQPER